MTSTDHVIAAAVAEACGSPMVSKTRLTEGFSNEVYMEELSRGVYSAGSL